jgi:hypothetical protein
VLSGNAPAFVCADVFSGNGHSLPLDTAQAPAKAEHEHDQDGNCQDDHVAASNCCTSALPFLCNCRLAPVTVAAAALDEPEGRQAIERPGQSWLADRKIGADVEEAGWSATCRGSNVASCWVVGNAEAQGRSQRGEERRGDHCRVYIHIIPPPSIEKQPHTSHGLAALQY